MKRDNNLQNARLQDLRLKSNCALQHLTRLQLEIEQIELGKYIEFKQLLDISNKLLENSTLVRKIDSVNHSIQEIDRYLKHFSPDAF